MLTEDQLLEGLTDAQRSAVTHVDGPLLIVAAAGSGKTRVITRRVAYLLAQGIPAPSILAITFTNKAAGEMKIRVGETLGRPVRDFGRLDQPWPMICTFHSLCLRILRHYAERVGLPANFSIFDTSDQNKLIKEALKALDISTTNFTPSSVHGAISNAKNQLLTPEAYANSAGDFYQRTVSRAYTKYQQLLKQNNALDFDDLLLRTAEAFRDYPEVLRELQDRFSYILIDEYQDTNRVQYVTAHALALRHRNICVVGDPDQSIYAWRGADIKNILDFEKDYPDAKVVKLEQNYRSTKTVLEIAGKLIANNSQRKEKALWTENPQGEPAELYLEDERDEAGIVAQRLKEFHDKDGVSWNGMAIFYRMNALSRVVEDALRRLNLPYQIARGVEFYNRKEIKDVLAYLRAVVNPSDEISLTRIVNCPPRGIGDTSVKQMQAAAISHGRSLWDAMTAVGSDSGLSARAVNATRAFVQQMKSWRGMLDIDGPPAEDIFAGQKGRVQTIMEYVVRTSGLEAALKKESKSSSAEDVGEGPMANVDELISSAAEYDRENPSGTLAEYLLQVSLVSDADHMKGAGGAITLMTLHAAKGLEFPVVAMVGLEEGILPHSRARADINQLEEERRLCFVGITRARQRLILSKASERTIRGLRERTMTSPFLNEMPRASMKLFDRTGLENLNDFRGIPGERQSQDFSTRFRKGTKVRHPTFGLGTVAELSGVGQHTRAVIDFRTAGRKTLVLDFAKLEPVM